MDLERLVPLTTPAPMADGEDMLGVGEIMASQGLGDYPVELPAMATSDLKSPGSGGLGGRWRCCRRQHQHHLDSDWHPLRRHYLTNTILEHPPRRVFMPEGADMPARIRNLIIRRGDSLQRQFNLIPGPEGDIADFSADLIVYNDDGSVLHSATSSNSELIPHNGYLTLDVSAATTTGLTLTGLSRRGNVSEPGPCGGIAVQRIWLAGELHPARHQS